MKNIYANRRLAQGYPDLEKTAFEEYMTLIGEHKPKRPDAGFSVEKLLPRIDRLVDLSEIKNVLVLGCGPRPQSVETLLERGFDAVGVEPVPSFFRAAREYLVPPERVLEGSAEEIPLPDSSQDLIICESVLEHVDSPTKSLAEVFRVLKPGGATYIYTTNRYAFSLKGKNGEYNVPYFNWLPPVVKESFVFQHLHYDPSLANYSLRPAVHWYSYADLCRLGRQAGFHQFYSLLDLLDAEDPAIAKSKARTFALNKLKYNPWLRALALTQKGNHIFMLKRK